MTKYNNKTIVYDNIHFKSQLERRTYQILKENGFNPDYEPHTYILSDKFILNENLLLYKPYKNKLSCKRKTILQLTYTTDFEFLYKDHLIIYDTKGMPNDTYPIKLKLFLSLLNTGEKILFFEPHNLIQVRQSIDILKNLS